MNLKEKFAMINFTDSQKKMLKLFGIIVGGIIVLIIILSIAKSISGGKVSYEQLENIMSRAAERYVTNSNDLFKGVVSGTEYISIEDLSSAKYMKDIDKYTSKDVSCSGTVMVYKNMDYYTYTPKLDCGKDYSTVLLIDKITENVTSTGSGLYSDDTSYFYRGENVNNYVEFSNQTWRIVSIDSQNNIELVQSEKSGNTVWDNRYNKDYKSTQGINNFQGVEPSRLKNYIMSAYNKEQNITKDARPYIVPKEYCIGKRSVDDTTKDNSVECKTLSELMGASTLTVSEYLRASLDEGCTSIKSMECTNYNYIAKMNIFSWSVIARSENSGYAYAIGSRVIFEEANRNNDVNLVVNVTGNIKYNKGIGTKDDPYIIGKTK